MSKHSGHIWPNDPERASRCSRRYVPDPDRSGACRRHQAFCLIRMVKSSVLSLSFSFSRTETLSLLSALKRVYILRVVVSRQKERHIESGREGDERAMPGIYQLV